ncbi:acyl-CoA dehydrogenase family protein [Streptomyces sp. NPDC060006]|uniref:acyl-CoA dehydrogenase family protein n=1 Tax=unclassified Streptomyces TaxID=2593676 RepID=UPI0036B4A78C
MRTSVPLRSDNSPPSAKRAGSRVPGVEPVAATRIVAARAATVAARLSHQLHGAMGITAEYPLHRHTTRLWAWRDEEGSEHEWSVRLGELACSDGEEAVWQLTTATDVSIGRTPSPGSP